MYLLGIGVQGQTVRISIGMCSNGEVMVGKAPGPTLLGGSDEVLADKIVKVPEMAESITEGTLKSWSKGESAR